MKKIGLLLISCLLIGQICAQSADFPYFYTEFERDSLLKVWMGSPHHPQNMEVMGAELAFNRGNEMMVTVESADPLSRVKNLLDEYLERAKIYYQFSADVSRQHMDWTLNRKAIERLIMISVWHEDAEAEINLRDYRTSLLPLSPFPAIDTGALYYDYDTRQQMLKDLKGDFTGKFKDIIEEHDEHEPWAHLYPLKIAIQRKVEFKLLLNRVEEAAPYYYLLLDLHFLYGLQEFIPIQGVHFIKPLDMLGRAEQGVAYIRELMPYLPQDQDSMVWQIYFTGLKAKFFNSQGEGDSALFYYDQALARFPQVNYPIPYLEVFAGIVGPIALYYAEYGQIHLCEEIIDKTIEMMDKKLAEPLLAHCEKISYEYNLLSVLSARAQIETLYNQLEKASQHTKDALYRLGEIEKLVEENISNPLVKSSIKNGELSYARAILHGAQGLIYMNTGQYQLSRAHYETALKNFGLLKSVEYFDCYSNYLLALFKMRDLKTYKKETKKFEKSAVDKGFQEVLPVFYANKGQSHLIRLEFEAAEKDFRKAIALSKTQNNGFYLATTYMKLGYSEAYQGNIEKARSILEDSVNWEVVNNSWISQTEGQLVRAYLLSREGKHAAAVAGFYQTIDTIEAFLEIFQGTATTLSYQGVFINFYDVVCNYFAENNMEADAFHMYERSRSRILNQNLVIKDGGLEDKLPNGLKEELRSIDRKINFYTQERIKPSTDSTYDVFLRNQIEELASHKKNLVYLGQAQLPEYAHLRYPEVATVEMVQEHLADDEALIEYIFTIDSAYVCAITKDHFTLRLIPYSFTLDSQVIEFRKLIERIAAREISGAQKAFYKQASQLYKDLIQPLDKLTWLKDKKWIIIPDGALYHLPFGALIKDQSVKESFDQFHYLILDQPISFAPSATTFCFFRGQPESAHRYQKEMLAFGDPYYPLQSILTSRGGNLDAYTTQKMKRDRRFGPIPESKREVETIVTMFNPEQVDSYLDSLASEGTMKQLNQDSLLSQYRYIHLASHGWMDQKYPDLSAIVLSILKEQEEDGFIRISEMMGLNIAAELLVLSACETATGKIVRGEGLQGFFQALSLAGAKRTILSLWAVDDHATADFFIDYYRNLLAHPDQDPMLSLWETQKAWITGSAEQANPIGWAPFVFWGENMPPLSQRQNGRD